MHWGAHKILCSPPSETSKFGKRLMSMFSKKITAWDPDVLLQIAGCVTSAGCRLGEGLVLVELSARETRYVLLTESMLDQEYAYVRQRFSDSAMDASLPRADQSVTSLFLEAPISSSEPDFLLTSIVVIPNSKIQGTDKVPEPREKNRVVVFRDRDFPPETSDFQIRKLNARSCRNILRKAGAVPLTKQIRGILEEYVVSGRVVEGVFLCGDVRVVIIDDLTPPRSQNGFDPTPFIRTSTVVLAL